MCAPVMKKRVEKQACFFENPEVGGDLLLDSNVYVRRDMPRLLSWQGGERSEDSKREMGN